MAREKKDQDKPKDPIGQIEPVGSTEVSTIHEVAPETPNPKPQEPQTAAMPANPTGNTLWKAFVFLFKLGVTLAILGAIAAIVYFGWPVIYARYIQPVQDNTARVTVLETNQKQSMEQIIVLQTQEANSANKQSLQAASIINLDSRIGSAEGQIAGQSATIEGLEKIQATLQAQSSQNSAELDRQIKVLKGMELLARARLFLYQSNFGLARQDLQSARGILAAVEATGTSQDGIDLGEVVSRLDLAIARLPEFPVAASDDLDIAWLVLMQGIPQIQPATITIFATATPTVVVPATPEFTPTPVPSGMPAPTATP